MSVTECRSFEQRSDELACGLRWTVEDHHGKPFARVLPLEPVKVRPKWKPHDELRAMMPFQMVPSEVLIAEDREDR